jgi:hypothetical protein
MIAPISPALSSVVCAGSFADRLAMLENLPTRDILKPDFSWGQEAGGEEGRDVIGKRHV